MWMFSEANLLWSVLLKVIFFARSEFSLIKFCKELCSEIAIKTNNLFKNFVKWCQKHELSSCFASSAFKSKNFAQIQENFARTCARLSAHFRSSAVRTLLPQVPQVPQVSTYFSRPDNLCILPQVSGQVFRRGGNSGRTLREAQRGGWLKYKKIYLVFSAFCLLLSDPECTKQARVWAGSSQKAGSVTYSKSQPGLGSKRFWISKLSSARFWKEVGFRSWAWLGLGRN